MIVEYMMTCDNCGQVFKDNRTWDMTQEQEGRFVIDIDMFGGFEMRCPHCGAIHYVPSVCDFIECEPDEDYEREMAEEHHEEEEE